AQEVGRLGRDVEAGGDRHALEGSFLGEPFPDAGQDRHVGIGPGDALATELRECRIGDVVAHVWIRLLIRWSPRQAPCPRAPASSLFTSSIAGMGPGSTPSCMAR